MKMGTTNPQQVVTCQMRVEEITDVLQSCGSIVASQTKAQIDNKNGHFSSKVQFKCIEITN